MKLFVKPLALRLQAAFHAAHPHLQPNVLVRYGDGVGEGALHPHYPFRFADMKAYLDHLNPEVFFGDDPLALEDALDQLPPGPAPARTAIDMALHDHWGKHFGYPLYQLWGLNPASAPASSITFSIPESLDDLRAKIQTHEGFPIFKLKLGMGPPDHNEAIVRTAREATSAHLCVDANCAWTVDQAAVLIPRLAAYDVLFVEQPLPRGDHNAWHRLRRRLPDDAPPLFADESVQTPADMLALADVIDGVNLKLAKAGGLRSTRRMITLARTLGLQVMLGCMIESSLALTAATHLAPLVDYADLDSYLHLTYDPYEGATLDQGRIRVPGGPGLGVVERVPA